MKILLCNSWLFGGGAETVMFNLVERLLEEGHDITVLASPPSDDDIKGTIYEKVHYIRMRIPTRSGKKYSPKVICNFFARKLFRIYGLIRMRFYKFDLAISIKEGVHIKDCSRIRAKRRISWIQCDLRDFPFMITNAFSSLESANKLITQKIDTVVCVSETAKEGYIKTIGDTGNVTVLYNPINWKRIRMLSDKECDHHRDPERPLIVAMGRLVESKGFMTLLKACSIIKDRLQFDLWILGEGPFRDKLEDYIRSNDLNFVKLFGDVSNPYPLIKQGDLFVSASVSESYGLAIQESLILGVPVVAVKNPGVAEWFDTRFGILIDDSADELAANILDLLGTPSLLDSYRNMLRNDYPMEPLYEERMEKTIRLLEVDGNVV